MVLELDLVDDVPEFAEDLEALFCCVDESGQDRELVEDLLHAIISSELDISSLNGELDQLYALQTALPYSTTQWYAAFLGAYARHMDNTEVEIGNLDLLRESLLKTGITDPITEATTYPTSLEGDVQEAYDEAVSTRAPSELQDQYREKIDVAGVIKLLDGRLEELVEYASAMESKIEGHKRDYELHKVPLYFMAAGDAQ